MTKQHIRETEPAAAEDGGTADHAPANPGPPAENSRHDDAPDAVDTNTDADTDADGPGSKAAGDSTRDTSSHGGRRLSISVRSLALGALITALIAAVGVMTWLYVGARNDLHGQTQLVADDKHAEQVALDYAVAAAIMDYNDLGPWKQSLVAGTTPELSEKLTKAAEAMEQILLPMQWTSTAKPLAAKVRSRENGVYVVDAFVSVMTKTVQAADSLQSTATYAVTVDSKNNWRITDVGGIAAVVGDK